MIKSLFTLLMLECLLLLSACSGDGGVYGTGDGSSTNQGQVLLGPVINAEVTIHNLFNQSADNVCTTLSAESRDLEVAGTFSFPADCAVDTDQLYVITATGGYDIDVDDDGVLDDLPSAVVSPVHTIISGTQLYQVKDWKVSKLTEQMYQYIIYAKENLQLTGQQLVVVMDLLSTEQLKPGASSDKPSSYENVLTWHARFDKNIDNSMNMPSPETYFDEHDAILDAIKTGVVSDVGMIPDSYHFNDQLSVPVSTIIESEIITIVGLKEATHISVRGGDYQINGGLYVSEDSFISNGDTLRLRVLSSADYNSAVTADVNVGGVTARFNVQTIEDTIPGPFGFSAITGAQLNQIVESEIITIEGLQAPAYVSISAGEFRINDAPYREDSTLVNNSDNLQVRLQSSDVHAEQRQALVTIGGVSATFSVTTLEDEIADPFVFDDVLDANVLTEVESLPVMITGLGKPVPISISGGEYRINGGDYGANASLIDPLDTVQVKVVTGALYGTVVNAELNIGGVTGVFSVQASDLAPVEAQRPLNDTGMIACANYAFQYADGRYRSEIHLNDLDCADLGVTATMSGVETFNGDPVPAGQDAVYGRDNSHNDPSDGYAGFSFKKLDANGNPLNTDASNWHCVEDNITGLLWEVKTNNVASLQHKSHTYTWYNDITTNNGGDHGLGDLGNFLTTGYETESDNTFVDGSDNCAQIDRCDVDKYIDDINASGLCGHNDWRLPSREELISILSYGHTNGTIDQDYFPNNLAISYWTSEAFAEVVTKAWAVSFATKGSMAILKGDINTGARLVRNK